MKKYFKLDINLKKVLKIFICTFIICSVALILTSIIPSKNINNNIEKSIEKMNNEGEYPIIMQKKTFYYRIDNWSESTLLNFIYNCNSKKPLECTFAQKTYTGAGSGLKDANLMIKELSPDSTHEEENKGHFAIRSSYWLGIRSIFRPLLVFMDYFEIRYIILFIGIFVSIFTIIKLGEKLKWLYAIAFGIILLCTNYFVGLFVGPNAAVYILTFLGMDYILLSKKKINYFNFMFVIGMLTTYFDWFTIPLISWGFITITILLKEYNEKKNIKFDELFNIVFKTGIAWCLGYASLLIIRVLCSYLVTGKEALDYFTGRVTVNTGMKNDSIIADAYHSLKNCINGLFPFTIDNKYEFLLVMGGIEFILILICLWLNKKNRKVGFPLLLISFAPLVWIITFNKFHVIHWWYAYRSIGIYGFAVMAIFMVFLDEIVNQLKKSEKFNKMIKKLKKTNIIKFLIVGGTSTLIDYFIYMIISLRINLITSKCISMVCACIFSFFANKNWTFNIKTKINRKMLSSYISVQIINIGVNTFSNYLLFQILHSKTISFVFATGIALVVNYILQNHFVFKEKELV